MNKNIIFSILAVILLGLGLWWFISRTTPQNTITPTPLVTLSAPAITITSPKNNESVGSLVTVTGRARVFENQFTVQIKDIAGNIVATAHVFSDAPDAGLYGNYNVNLSIPSGTGTNFKIEALSYSPKGDGSFEGYASVMVKLNFAQ